MKSKITICAAILAGLGMLHSCSSTQGEPSGQRPVPIRLSGGGSAIVSSHSRAEAFPNTTIGVVASYYQEGGNPTTADWTSYENVNNARAYTGAADAEGVYGFTWEQAPKYWPFDTTKLVFMAYSPYTDNTQTNLLIDIHNQSLNITLKEDMQDVLYASGNVDYRPFDKRDGTVDLGTFKHALSKLTVEVVAGDNMNPGIVVTSLKVSTDVPRGIYYFALGDSGMSLSDPVNGETFMYDFIGSSTAFGADEQTRIRKEALLFPGTEDGIRINIQLADGGTGSFGHTYMMSDFQDINTQQSLTLERGKQTVIRFRIQSVDVNPSDIDLQGQLVDWFDGGKLGTTIE